MQNKALVIIDIQNDTTKNYKDIINNVNNVIGWATANNIHVIYIRHENLSAGTRTCHTAAAAKGITCITLRYFILLSSITTADGASSTSGIGRTRSQCISRTVGWYTGLSDFTLS